MKSKLHITSVVLTIVFAVFISADANGQHTVSGTVIDASTSESLPAVNILIQGTTRGTTSNADGEYEITVESSADTLVFSYVGFESQEVPIEGRSEIDVSLQPVALVGEDVVVVGYGTQQREDVTGSVGMVDAENLQSQSTHSISESLQGQTAGVQVQGASHPGAAPSIQIRGANTFGNNDPLYVVDGVPVDNINDFNMKDVESVQVLKDASSAAIYGARGANGVVMITTKGGQPGTMQIEYEGSYGTQELPENRWYDLVGREGYQQLNNTARQNAGLPLIPGNDPSSDRYVDDVSTDWQKETFTTGIQQEHNLTVSGGNEVSRYSITGGYIEDEGYIEGNGPSYDRYSARVNSDHDVTDFLKVGQSLYYSTSEQKHQNSIHASSFIDNVVNSAPTVPVYDENRLGGYGGPSADVHNAIVLNPVGYNNLIESQSDRRRFLGNIWGEVNFLDNFNYKLNFSYDRTDFTDFYFQPEYDLGYFFNEGIARMDEDRGEESRLLIENTLEYANQFGEHDVELLAGYTEERNDFRVVEGHAEGFSQPYYKVLSAGTEGQSATGFQTMHNLRSFFGRVNYNYDSRYLFSATVRRDGSSRFSEQHQYGVFPSASVGWRVSNEEFFNVDQIDELKVRASYGQMGNQEIGDFPYTAFINPYAHYVFGDELAIGAIQTSLSNPNVRWETNSSADIGIDVTMLNNRLTFSADYYNHTSSDILVDVPIPESTGSIGNPTVNAAEVQNKGLEFSATWRDEVGDFGYNLSGNLTTINNEVLAIGGLGEPINGSGSRTEVGGEIGQIYGYVTDGIFQSEEEVNDHAFQAPETAPGDIRFKDLDGNGQITSEDRTYLGSAIPDFYFGFNTRLNYRSWDLTMSFQGNYGNKIINWVRESVERMHEMDNYSTDMLDHWTEDNRDTDVPRPIIGDPNFNHRMSNRWVEDGSYVKLQNLVIGYTLSDSFLNSVNINNLRIYARGQNLLILTKYSGYDPELGPGGFNNANDALFSRAADSGSFPQPRVLMLGLQLNL